MLKTGLSILSIIIFFTFSLTAQITTDPPLPTANEPVVITFDATQGGGGLAGYTGDVYAHTGVTIQGVGQWQYVIGGWGNNDEQPQLTRIGDDLYQLEITPSIRAFYGVPSHQVITEMCFVFRAAEGSPQTEDLFVTVVEEGLNVSILSPVGMQPVFAFNDIVPILANANEADSIALRINNAYITSTTEDQLSYNWQADSYGQQHILVTAYGEDNETAEAETSVFIRQAVTVASLPDDVVNGINYIDANTVTLVLHDPPALKEFVFVIGDMNDWTLTEDHHMYRTPDGTRFWLTLTGLETDTEYGFQYYIDGELRLADPYTHKVLDPWNDHWISDFNYPDLKPYPHGETAGIVSILHPGRPAYEWEVTDFTPPAVEDMVIYELLIRDFVETSAIKTVMDSLDYLQNLGVNVIELMPVNQFEGNISWGYNPALYFATDKAYGTREDYKRFIDEAHKRGMAVVLDIVLNHSFNLSPLVQMYFDPEAGGWGQPLPENPWYLETCPHEPWCWGNTFDQDSPYTQELFKRIVQYWITEFNVDGFRFDFTKGFTNEQTGGQGWNYDAARIANLKRIADEVWEVNPDAYVILEHFTENAEEKELSDYGMLIWGNITHAYQEAAMGWLDNSNFDWISYQNRGWDDPHLIGYMESHDEERIMFKNITWGNSSNPDHNIKNLSTALRRAELVAAFYFPIPGPKMIWQFGELGYDYSINHCQDGTIDEGCRTDPKPIRWDYFDDWRRHRVYTIYSLLANLKQEHDVFRTDDYSLSLQGPMKRIHLNHPSRNVTVLGNFGVVAGDMQPNFQETGTWYEYFSGDVLQVTDVNQTIQLQPGEYRMYSTVAFPEHGEPLVNPEPDNSAQETIKIYPNPARHVLNISATDPIQSVEIIDMVGRTISRKVPMETYTTITTSHLNPGLYFVRVKTAEGVITESVRVVR
ncbi:MAG: T9SS C-terminal target domain-containing protein [Bacteroidia bacterium]|nr:MAG: T9SS C-terminal target domain-containing protein [Bacteroidia bacterium]